MRRQPSPTVGHENGKSEQEDYAATIPRARRAPITLADRSIVVGALDAVDREWETAYAVCIGETMLSNHLLGAT